jgi:hypothetical protein
MAADTVEPLSLMECRKRTPARLGIQSPEEQLNATFPLTKNQPLGIKETIACF